MRLRTMSDALHSSANALRKSGTFDLAKHIVVMYNNLEYQDLANELNLLEGCLKNSSSH